MKVSCIKETGFSNAIKFEYKGHCNIWVKVFDPKRAFPGNKDKTECKIIVNLDSTEPCKQEVTVLHKE